MKIAVLADIHANNIALQTVASHVDAWRPDYVIVAGDVVNRGPLGSHLMVIQTLVMRNWFVIISNGREKLSDLIMISIAQKEISTAVATSNMAVRWLNLY